MINLILHMKQEGAAHLDAHTLSGRPRIPNSRVPIFLILAELADGYSIDEIAEDMDLNKEDLTRMLEVLAKSFDQCFALPI